MHWNIVGAFIRNNPFGTEIAFRKGLERVGETVTAIDPSYPNQVFDEAPDVTVVFKWLDEGPYREKVKSLPGHKIVYQVDDLRFPHIKDMMIKMHEICDHALTFDDDGARLAKEYGFKSAKKMLLTADNHLYRHIPKMQKDIDVCFVGSMSNGPNHTSRMKMLDIVSKMKGIKLVVANELFDINKICELYNRSKIVLNHATDVGQPFGQGFGYQCRHFEAGFTKTCIMSNKIVNDNALSNIMTFDGAYSLEQGVYGLKNSVELREMLAGGLYNELNAAHLPEHRGEQMIQFVKDIS